MAENIIKNDSLIVKTDSLGAEMQSITDVNGREYLWYGDEKYWGEHAPLLFPVCGGLIDDSYILNGKKYSMPKHGFAKNSYFILETSEDSSCTYLLKSDEKSKEIFPFDYELRVTYTLCKRSVSVKYSVKNLSDETMYFSIGAHEGYFLPGGIEEYNIEFENKETLDTFDFNGSFPNGKKHRVLTDSRIFPLEYKYFEDDTLMFSNLNSKKASILHKNGEKIVEVNFGEFDYLLLWTVPSAPYICIEPWQGAPDFVGHDMDFTKKKGNTALITGEVFEIKHSIMFE